MRNINFNFTNYILISKISIFSAAYGIKNEQNRNLNILYTVHTKNTLNYKNTTTKII